MVSKAIKCSEMELGTALETLASFKHSGSFGSEPETKSASDSHCTLSVLPTQSPPSADTQGWYPPLPSFVPWPAFLEPPASLATKNSGTEDLNSLGDEAMLLLGSGKHSLSQNSNALGASDAQHPLSSAEASSLVPSNSDETADAGETTTLMVLGIPNRIKLRSIIGLFNSHGFENSYDLVYMPFGGKKNQGYVFVNFKDPEGALAFAQAFDGFQFPNFTSQRRTFTKPAACQGFEANMRLHTDCLARDSCKIDDCLAIFR